MTNVNVNRFVVNIDGINTPRFFSEECFRSALNFKPKPGDILVVTYPKCGTTWMQNLVLNILRRGQSFKNPRDFFLASPFLDQLGAEDSERLIVRPGIYKTHLPLHKVPWSDEAKYIYVSRNPKDCCISFYHHTTGLPGYDFEDGSFDEFLEMFVKGEVEYGNYFDHLLPWYNSRKLPNVFFTTFESMKRNLKQVAVEVAEFIDKDAAEFLDKNPHVLEEILYNCSFEVMKSTINRGLSSLYNIENEAEFFKLPKGRRHIITYVASLQKGQGKTHKLNFIRQGTSGSWRSFLTKQQEEVLNREIKKAKNLDAMSLWDNVL